MGIKHKIIKELTERPRSLRELRQKIGGRGKPVTLTVEELVKKGKLVQYDGLYSVPGTDAENARPYTLVKLRPAYGFARPVDHDGPDIYIPEKLLLGALPGDGILAVKWDTPRGPVGSVLGITRPRDSFVGVIVRTEEGRLALAPDVCPTCPILIKKSADGGALEGEKAAVEILERGDTHEAHRAGVSMRFGSANDAKQCVKALLYGVGISKHFPAKVKEEAKKYNNAAVTEKECAGRADFRALPVFTLDGADTKDIDDAISLEKLPEGGWRLGVHIADVSEYVRPGTALDDEAFQRGTSVYYADSVVPMLPRALSNGICSLNEGVDRLTFSCLLTLSEEAVVLRSEFVKSVIRSRVQGVYSEVNALWAGTADGEVRQKYAAVADELAEMHTVYEKLSVLRAVRGAMAIETGEAKLTLDEAGRCVDVRRHIRGDAERMIEEFMLLANTAAAKLAKEKDLPFVYRVHEKPDPARVEALRQTLGGLGVSYHFPGDIPTPRALAALLDETRGTPLERVVHESVLRSLAKAQYSPAPDGHFGLALADYAHFTSPIRRYPDLAVHRVLSAFLAGADAEALRKKHAVFTAAVAKQASEREIAAAAVENGAVDRYRAEWIRPFIGLSGEEGVFPGIICSVKSFGFFVELPNTVEGLVQAETLSPDELTVIDGVILRDERTGRVWRIGDAVRVRPVQADVSTGRITFVLSQSV